MPHVNFAKFLVLNAAALESMTFHIEAKFNTMTCFWRNNITSLSWRTNWLQEMLDFILRPLVAANMHATWNTKQLHDLGLN